jgi:hypothetical protein
MKPGGVFHGQALAETALFGMLVVLLAGGLLAWIPVHRARTAATTAAYGCAQYLSQTPNPGRAAISARQVAQQTLHGDWSATAGVRYRVQVIPPAGSGQPGRCAVSYQTASWFARLLGLDQAGWDTVWFISRSESWKARWR